MFENETARQLIQSTYAFVVSRAIIDLAEMGVADALGETAESSDVLGQRIGAHPDALRRVLRLLATQGIFREESAGRFVHTDQSRLLRSDHPQSLRDLVRSGVGWKVLSELSTTLRTGQPATAVLAPDGFFAYLANHPDEARRFNESMTAKARLDCRALTQAYDFSIFKLIVDVGGGRGHLMKTILAANAGPKGVVFDLPQVVANLSGLSSERLGVQAGDFFKDKLPAADGYLLMNVLHDWADPQAANILEAVRRSAPRDSKVLVIEAILPEQAEPSATGYHRALLTDVVMLAIAGGRERTLSEYEALLGQAGFGLDRMIPTTGDLSLIECSPLA